jgi:hypothetical protein
VNISVPLIEFLKITLIILEHKLRLHQRKWKVIAAGQLSGCVIIESVMYSVKFKTPLPPLVATGNKFIHHDIKAWACFLDSKRKK